MSLRQPLLVVTILVWTSTAIAGTHIDYTVAGDRPVIESVLISNGKLRMNQHGINSWILYDLASHTLYMIDDDTGTYWLVNGEEMERILAQIERSMQYTDEKYFEVLEQLREFDERYPELMKFMKQADETLPRTFERFKQVAADDPEVSEELEAMEQSGELDEVLAMFDDYSKFDSWQQAIIEKSREYYEWSLQNTTRFSVEETGETRTVAGYSCQITEVHLTLGPDGDPVKETEYCSVPPEALNMPAEDLAVFQGLNELNTVTTERMNTLTIVPPAVAEHLGIESEVDLGLGGLKLDNVPIETRYYGGQPTHTKSTIQVITTDVALDAAQFQMPDSYSRHDLDTGLEQIWEWIEELESLNETLE